KSSATWHLCLRELEASGFVQKKRAIPSIRQPAEKPAAEKANASPDHKPQKTQSLKDALGCLSIQHTLSRVNESCGSSSISKNRDPFEILTYQYAFATLSSVPHSYRIVCR